MDRLIVDGYNVIRCDTELRELEAQAPLRAVARLLALLGTSRLARYSVIVVLDGRRPAAESVSSGKIRLIYSGSRSADEVIAEICDSGDVVVTNDRGLRAATLSSGPVVWSVDKLMALVRGRTDSRGKRERSTDTKRDRAVRLKTYQECLTCKYANRDDWVFCCWEDSELGWPKNYKRSW